ncbi:hypothetical protein [Actinoallomurus oryzae]
MTCACLLAACGSDDESEKPVPSASARSTAASAASSPAAAASPACPSRAQIADAVSAADHSTGVIVSTKIVCQDGWATAPMRYPGSDPSRAVVRVQGGDVRLVTYGTDGLCESPKMKKAPAEIKKALGVYC